MSRQGPAYSFTIRRADGSTLSAIESYLTRALQEAHRLEQIYPNRPAVGNVARLIECVISCADTIGDLHVQ